MFNDIWRLDIDIDMWIQKEEKSEKTKRNYFDPNQFYKNLDSMCVGPWKRCFGCERFVLGLADYGDVNDLAREINDQDLKRMNTNKLLSLKCAGTCEGAVYFCSKKCKRDAWPRHKSLHGCRRKVTVAV